MLLAMETLTAYSFHARLENPHEKHVDDNLPNDSAA